MPSLVEIAVPMDGSVTHATQRALVITTLMHQLGWYEPSMSIEMYLVKPSPTSCLTLLIRLDSLPKVEIPELPMSYSTGGLLRLAWAGVGELTKDLTRTTITATYLSLRRAMQIARSLIVHY